MSIQFPNEIPVEFDVRTGINFMAKNIIRTLTITIYFWVWKWLRISGPWINIFCVFECFKGYSLLGKYNGWKFVDSMMVNK